MTAYLLVRSCSRAGELTVSWVLSYTASAILRVTRVTANAVPCIDCNGALFPMPFALGRDDAEPYQLGSCVERDGMFGDKHALDGDQKKNDRRRGDQLTDAKARLARQRWAISDILHRRKAASLSPIAKLPSLHDLLGSLQKPRSHHRL